MMKNEQQCRQARKRKRTPTLTPLTLALVLEVATPGIAQAAFTGTLELGENPLWGKPVELASPSEETDQPETDVEKGFYVFSGLGKQGVGVGYVVASGQYANDTCIFNDMPRLGIAIHEEGLAVNITTTTTSDCDVVVNKVSFEYLEAPEGTGETHVHYQSVIYGYYETQWYWPPIPGSLCCGSKSQSFVTESFMHYGYDHDYAWYIDDEYRCDRGGHHFDLVSCDRDVDPGAWVPQGYHGPQSPLTHKTTGEYHYQWNTCNDTYYDWCPEQHTVVQELESQVGDDGSGSCVATLSSDTHSSGSRWVKSNDEFRCTKHVPIQDGSIGDYRMKSFGMEE